MSYSNSTPHYGLPQYIGSDKPTYLGDANEAYNKIDEKIFESITIANQAKATAESSAGIGESVVTSVNANTASIATIQNKITDIDTVKQNAGQVPVIKSTVDNMRDSVSNLETLVTELSNRLNIQNKITDIDTVKQNAGQVPVIKSTVDNMRDSVSNLETLVTELSNRLNRFALDKVYPIGSIYLSVNAANPSTFLGGTWERISDKFLIGAGGKYSATSSGGNELPIGSIYLSVNAANPSTFLGGTWERISDKFLIGAGGKYSATSSGGNELIMIAQDQTPWVKINSEQQGWGLSNDTSQSGGLGFKDRVAIARPEDGSQPQQCVAIARPEDGSQPQQYIKLIPPYFAVYMWKRVY